MSVKNHAIALDLEFSRSDIKFAICQSNMMRLPRNEKQIHGLNSRPQVWPSGLTLAMILTRSFEGQIWICCKSSKMVWLPQNKKQTYWLNSRPQMLPLGLTLDIILKGEVTGVPSDVGMPSIRLLQIIDGRGIFGEIAVRWLSLDLTDDKSALVQAMAWCSQATNHYLSQRWPRSMALQGHNEFYRIIHDEQLNH